MLTPYLSQVRVMLTPCIIKLLEALIVHLFSAQ